MNGFTIIDNLTGEYPDCEKIALNEEWAKGLIYCDIDGFFIGEDGALVLTDDCGNTRWCPADRFTVIFESLPIKREKTAVGDYRCPSCNAAFIDVAGITPYCGNCGQRLDWSERQPDYTGVFGEG